MGAKVFLKFLFALHSAVALVRSSATPRSPILSFPITHRRNSGRILKRADKDTNVPIYNESSVSYLIELNIGTPGQKVKVALDTGSDELWVDPDCTSSSLDSSQASECASDGNYQPNSSTTSSTTQDTKQINYGIGAVQIEYFKDTISVPDSTITLKDVQFGVAIASQQLGEGILGLGFGKNQNLNYNNFIDLLTAEHITNLNAFSLALGSAEANNGGVIIFGGVDTKKFSGPLVANDILISQTEDLRRYWVQMTKLQLSRVGQSAKAIEGANVSVVLDSGSSISYLPKDLTSLIAEELHATLDEKSNLYYLPCKTAKENSTIDFTFGQATIRVPFSEFMLDGGGDSCILGVADAASGSGITALLGDTFLRSAYVVFDQTNEKISMAQYSNCGQNEKLIPTNGASFTGECKFSLQSQSDKPNSAGQLWISSLGLVAPVFLIILTSLL